VTQNPQATRTSSTPSFSEFDPTQVPYQAQVIDDVFHNFDYSLGTHEILLSGSVGSAKSILMAHIAVRILWQYPGALGMMCREALPDLRDTIYRKICDHIEGSFTKGVDYWTRETNAYFKFSNRSEMISRTWSDNRFTKPRSLELAFALFEELIEVNEEDKAFYDETVARVGRQPHVPIQLVLCATNPDSPAHWAYKHFIEPNSGGKKHPTRHVYYSVTSDNPFLPASYTHKLLENYDEKMAKRMVFGLWLEIKAEVVYDEYGEKNKRLSEKYKVNSNFPITITWDFNIGQGKPMSVVIQQYDPQRDELHIFNEVIIEGMRTLDSCDELAAAGLLDFANEYVITGDATGRSRDTRSKRSDYDIIESFLANYITESGNSVRFRMETPRANPAVRERHNKVNAYCKNALGKHRLFVYEDAPTIDEGLRLTALKKGGQYIEDDSKRYQHCTTALGYGLMTVLDLKDSRPQGSVEL